MKIKTYLLNQETKFIWIVTFISILISLSFSSTGYAQIADFTISRYCNLNKGNGVELIRYIKNSDLQTLIGDSTTSEPIKVYFIDQKVDFGNGKVRPMNQTLLNIFTNWQLPECKVNNVGAELDSEKPEPTKIWAPFTYIPERIAANWNIRTTWTNQTRNLSSMDYYVNPYIQAFGGDPLGIPFAYGVGTGITIGFGTLYSGPMETDFVSGGLHFAIFNVAVTSHVKEFVLKYSSGSNQEIESPNAWLGNWNNLFTPHLGIDFAMEIPVVRVSYFATIDTLDGINDPPITVLNEVTGEPMKNNIVRGQHFGFEIRTPNLIFYNSTRAKFYFAKQFGEYHLGYVGREMKIDDFIFDFRMDATFPGPRDFQLLTELYIDSPWPGFANKSFGIGPSLRLGSTPSNNFGVISAFINARFKIGDFFDKNIY